MIRLFLIFTVISTVFCNTPTGQIFNGNNTSTQNATQIVNDKTQIVNINNTRNSEVNIEQNIVQQTVISTSTTTTPKPQTIQSPAVSTIKRNYRFPHIVVLPSISRPKSQQSQQSQVKLSSLYQPLQKSPYSTQSEQIAAQNVQNYPYSDSIQFVTTDIGTQYRENNDFSDTSTNRLTTAYDYSPYALYNPYYPLNLFKPFRPINPYLPYYSYPYYPILPYNPIQSYHAQPEITTNSIQNNIDNSTRVVQNVGNSQYVGQNNDPIVSSVRINNGPTDVINDQSSSVENSVESVENPTTVVSPNNNDKNNQDLPSDSAALESNSNENEVLDVYVPIWIGPHSEYRYLEGPPLAINNY